MPVIETGTGNVTTNQSNSATSLASNKPANVADGDLLLAYALFRNTAATITPPAGWTLIGAQETSAFTEAVFYKPIPSAAGESATSYTFTTSSTSGRANLIIARATGVNLTTPLQATGAWAVGSSGVVTMASLTATGAGQLVAVAARNNGSGTASPATWSGSLVTAASILSGTSSVTETYIAQQAISAAGATGTRTATLSPQTATAGQMFILNPLVTNIGPTANAGPDQSNIEPYSVVTLDGSASSDPDGTITTYAWSQTSGTSVTLSSGSAQKPTFTAPATMDGTTLVFSLVVTDNNGATSTADTVSIQILPHNEWYRSGGAWVPVQGLARSGGVWV